MVEKFEIERQRFSQQKALDVQRSKAQLIQKLQADPKA